MPRHPAGTLALLDGGELTRLSFPPPGEEVVIAVHDGALKAPESPLTLAAYLEDGAVAWVGALDERMIAGALGRTASPRPLVADRLFEGGRCWSVVWPGPLLRDGRAGPRYTLYHGDRPWIVLGELTDGSLLAAPLNDAGGNPRWYAPRIGRGDLEGAAPKDGQLEMAHLWSLPGDLHAAGAVREAAWPALRQAVGGYYGVPGAPSSAMTSRKRGSSR